MAASLYNLLGIDQLGAERVITRSHRQASPSAAVSRYAPASVQAPSAADIRSDLTSRFPGVPPQGLLGWPLGFNTVTFTATSGTALQALARPQRPFKGNRLIVEAARTGASATGLLSVASIVIGTTPQAISNQPLTAGMFGPTATDIILDLQQAQPGIDVLVNYIISAAPTTTDTVAVGTAMMSLTAG